MKITPNWTFDFDDPQPDPAIALNFDTLTTAEFMAILARHVVSGPVAIDRLDRYGWTAIPIVTFSKFQADLIQALQDWQKKP